MQIELLATIYDCCDGVQWCANAVDVDYGARLETELALRALAFWDSLFTEQLYGPFRR